MRSTLRRNPRPAAEPGSANIPIAELLDAAPTMLYACGADGSVAFVSQRLREFVGIGSEGLLGRRWTGLLDSNEGGPLVNMFLAAQQARREYEFKYRARRRDRQSRVLVDCGRPRFAADGTFIGYVGSLTDITEYDLSTDEPAASESRFRRLADAAPVMIWMTGTDKGWTYVNRRWLEFTGRALEMELGSGWTDSIHRDDLQRCLAAYSQAFDTRESFSMEYRLRRRDGEYGWVWSRGEPSFASDGRFEGYVGSCVDITDRRQAETLTWQSEARLRALFDSDVVPLFYWDEDGRVLDANDAYLRFVGAHRDEIEAGSLRWPELTPAEHLRLDQMALAAVFAGNGSAAAFEREYVRPDGRRVTALVAGTLLPGRSGQGVALAVDLTDRKRAEAALCNSEELVRSVFSSLYGYVAIVDRSGKIVAVNDAWKQFAGHIGGVREPVGIGANYLELCRRAAARGDQTGAAALEGIHSVLGGQAQSYTLEYKSLAREQERWFEINVLPLRRPEGGVLVFHLDVTARHRAELEAQRLRGELFHVTRVSMMGELTASLAHELNQPLTAILSNTQAALRLLDGGSEVPAEVREILQDIALDDQRAGDIIRRLRQLMKKDQFQLQPVDLNKLVVDVSILLESDALIREMTIERDLAASLPRVLGDRIQLQQVLLNLILNGLDAMKTMPNDGSRRLVVSTGSDAQNVRIAVTDAGIGLPAGRADLIFEPFFSTKSDGMGMGLSISRSILVAHGGRIVARNNAERGATFEMELPVMTENEP